MEEARSKRKSRDSKRAISFHNGSSKDRLDIQDKPRFKKRVSNKVPQNSLRLWMRGCMTLSLGREGILAHQPRSQLVNSLARSIMVIVLGERIIVLVVVKVDTKFEIAQM